ncbi:MAG TPA: hypothetical protein PL182_04705 [Pseudobdellovibrionaceae bacterium]|nr:hypothetical protein [Pseudobdellovibrionaceae bacterium]
MDARPNFESPEEDQEDILSDQDQTSLSTDPSDDLRGKGGPSALDLEDEPVEFARGEIDVKTQMDRTTRIAKASATRHYDLDDSPDTTPGGLEEVFVKTDRDLNALPRKTQDELEDEESLAEEENIVPEGKNFIDIDEVSEEVDLSSEQLDYGEMNEADAREAGYFSDGEFERTKPLPPSHAQESPTGSLTDVGAGRSSAVKTKGKHPLH